MPGALQIEESSLNSSLVQKMHFVILYLLTPSCIDTDTAETIIVGKTFSL